MRVLIDTSFAARGASGTAVYIERLTEALRARGNVEVVEARRRRRPAPGRTHRRGRCSGARSTPFSTRSGSSWGFAAARAGPMRI